MKKLMMMLILCSVPSFAQTVLTDIHMLGAIGSMQYGVTNNYDVAACIERELHDGQWLAGGCKDILYLVGKDSIGNQYKAFHLGGAYMSNAQHGNQSFQLKVGFDLNSLGTMAGNGMSLLAPALNKLSLPPWVGHIGQMITLDFAGGYRPIHDSSVNGNWTYGIAASVDVPIETTFEWLISGL